MANSDITASYPTAQFKTPRGFTYHYIHLQPSTLPKTTPPKPPILILHGFPSIPADFHSQMTHLHAQDHRIIAPYLLGYHPTSTPSNPFAYRLKLISQDLIALLDDLGVSQVIGLGHDWGATLLSRLEYYHPSRFTKLIYLSIAPVPFGQEFDLDKVNEMTRQMTGQAMFGYQKFFMASSSRAGELMGEQHDRMEMLMFARDSERLWKEYFCAIGGLEKWLDDDERIEMFERVTEDMLAQRRLTFRPRVHDADSGDSSPGYAGPLNWYVSHNRNLNMSDEQSERADWQDYRTAKDVLLVLGEHDPPSPPGMHISMAQAYVEDVLEQLTIVRLEAGHFLMIQEAYNLDTVLDKFLNQ